MLFLVQKVIVTLRSGYYLVNRVGYLSGYLSLE